MMIRRCPARQQTGERVGGPSWGLRYECCGPCGWGTDARGSPEAARKVCLPTAPCNVRVQTTPARDIRPRRSVFQRERRHRRRGAKIAHPPPRSGATARLSSPRAHPRPNSCPERSHLQGSVDGILVQGSNGEAQHLSREERKRVIRLTRDTLDDHGHQHVLVIAGTGTQSTRETKQLNVDAKEAGASYALILTPSTWKSLMTKDLILRFFREV